MMTRYDVFNGDADGLCALQQLRLAEPADSVLVTGVKRDIKLLRRVDAGAGDEVTVLDISLDQNLDGLLRVLARGARVRYFDHHFAGEVPEHPALQLRIDPAPDLCTSLLVDRFLEGRFRAWAVVGAFGDNFDDSATQAAQPLDLSPDQLGRLRELGIYLNYNAYGASIADLHFAPEALAQRLRPYADPLAFIAAGDTFAQLRAGYHEDLELAGALKPELAAEHHALYVLPDQAWARRVSGVLANQLAQATPERAHALLTRLPGGGYLVSVRAPLNSRTGADALCRQFPGGGGRQAAAGINELAEASYEAFVAAFRQAYP